MNRSLLAAAVAACALAGTAQAQDADDGMFAAKNFTATAILTSDYRFRGISNSDGFAFQGSLDWNYQGFNAGVFGSNTVFSDNNIEIDLYAGYSWEWLGLNWRGQLFYYMFPGEGGSTSKGLDPPGSDPTINGGIPSPYAPGGPRAGQIPDIGADYFEVALGVSKTFDIPFSPTVGVTYNYSPDFFGEDDIGQHIQVSLSAEGPWGLIPYANWGRQDVKGGEYSEYFATPKGYDYWWYSAGLRKAVGGFTLDAGYVSTDNGTGCGDNAGVNPCDFNGGFETFYNDFDYITAGGTSYRDLTQGSWVFQISRTF
jgi:hypothetical protein